MTDGREAGNRTQDGAVPARRRPQCEIWGVLNVTPDSFSDGGLHCSHNAALRCAEAMVEQGADVIDVGGESTRPAGATYGAGAQRVPVEEELRRVLSVVEALGRWGVRVSIDTRKAEVAQAAIGAGATIVNDVSARSDKRLLEVVAATGTSLVRMHSRGQGQVQVPFTTYEDVVSDVVQELSRELTRAAAAGIPRSRLWADPGLGFAKTAEQSRQLLKRLQALRALGVPLLVGASRKSFLGALTSPPDGLPPAPSERLGAGLSAACWAALQGAAAVRVHDVFETHQALTLIDALRDGVENDGRLRGVA